MRGGINTYGYVHQNPLRYIDPKGLLAFLLPALPYIPPAAAAVAEVCAVAGAAAWAGYQGLKAWNDAYSAEDASDADDVVGSPDDKKLTPGEVDKLKGAGHDPYDLKPKKNGSKYVLFKDKNGHVIVKPKNGNGPGDPTGLNINNF